MTSGQVSALLERQRYEVTERLFNLYHLLRRSRGENRVRGLVDALVGLYASPGPTDARAAVAGWGSALPRGLHETVVRPRA